jgi:hypothetical protein
MTTRSMEVLLGVLVLLACGWSGAAGAQEEELDREGQRVFRNYTRVFCLQFFEYEDRFILLPNYYRAREASTGKTYDQAVEELTETRTERAGGNIVRHIEVLPPRGEAIAVSLVLPAIDVGHYGFIDAVTVVRVISENEMIVKDLRLIDPAAVGSENNTHRRALAERQKGYVDTTYRLHGFRTVGLTPGTLYRGPEDAGLHIAVAGADQHHNYVLINYERMRRIRTSQFADALAYVGITPAAFNEMVRGNREQHGAQGDKATLIGLYKRYYTAFRVPRPGDQAGPGRVPDAAPATREPDPQNDPEPGPSAEPDPTPDAGPNDPPPAADPPADDSWHDEDDWDDDWVPPDAPDDPGFFGIPLD